MTRSSSESDHIMFRRTNQHCAESTSVHFCPLCKNSPFFRLPGRFALLLENVFSASFTLKQFCRCRLGPIYVDLCDETSHTSRRRKGEISDSGIYSKRAKVEVRPPSKEPFNFQLFQAILRYK